MTIKGIRVLHRKPGARSLGTARLVTPQCGLVTENHSKPPLDDDRRMSVVLGHGHGHGHG